MNNIKISVDAALNITEIKTKGLKAGKLEFEISQKPFDEIVKVFKSRIADAVQLFSKLKIPDLNLKVSADSISRIKKQIEGSLGDIKVSATPSLLRSGTKRSQDPNVINIQNIRPFLQMEKMKADARLKGIKDGERAVEQAAKIEARTARENFSDRLKQIATLQKELAKLGAAQARSAGGGRGAGGGGVTLGGTGGLGGEGFSNFARQFQDIASGADQSTRSLRGLRQVSEEVARKASAFRAVAIGLNSIVNASKEAVRFTIDFDSKLRDLNKILQTTDAGIAGISKQILELGQQTGVAAEQVADTALEFARAGLEGRGFGSVLELTNKALLGAQGTTLSLAQSTDILIQTIGQIESGAEGLNKELVTTTRLFDILGRAEDITASQAKDVQEAFKRSAGTLFQTNASLEQVVALLSVTEERTKRGGDVIGTAFKTIATRITDSSSQSAQALQSIGVAVTDSQGKLRSIFDIIQDTAVAFQSLSQEEQANIAATVAGVRQVEIFRSVVTSANRTFDVYNDLLTASGDAARKQAEEQKKLSVQIEKIKNQLLSIVNAVDTSGLGKIFRGILQVTESLLGAFIKLDQSLGNALSSAIGFTTVIVIVKTLTTILLGIKDAIKPFIEGLRIGKIEGEKVTKTIEGVGQSVATNASKIALMNTAFVESVKLTDLIANNLARVSKEAQLAAANAQLGLPGAGAQQGTGLLNRQQRGQLLQDPNIANRVGAALRPEAEFTQVTKDINKNIGDLAGRLLLTGKAADIASARIMAVNQLYNTQTSLLGKMGQQATKLGTGLANTTIKIATSTIGLGILGSVVSSFGDELKKGGQAVAGAALEITGLTAQGAALGLTFGPLGGVIGGVAGAIIGLTSNLLGAQDKLSIINKELEKLGKFDVARIGESDLFAGPTKGEKQQRVAAVSQAIDTLSEFSQMFTKQAIAPTIEFKEKLSKATDGVADKFKGLAQRAEAFKLDPEAFQREVERLITGSLAQATGGKTTAFNLQDLQTSVLNKAGVKFSKDVFDNLAKIIVEAAPTDEIKQSLRAVVEKTTQPSIEVIKGLTENLIRQSRGAISGPDVVGTRRAARFESLQSGRASDLSEVFEAAKELAKIGPAKLASDLKLLKTQEEDLAQARLDSLRIENDLAEQSRLFAQAQRQSNFAEQLRELGDVPAQKIESLVQTINIEFNKLPKAQQTVSNFVEVAKASLAQVSELSTEERRAVKTFFDNFIESQRENVESIQRRSSERTAIGGVEAARAQLADKQFNKLKDIVNIEQQQTEVTNLLSSSLEKLQNETAFTVDSSNRLIGSLIEQVDASEKALESAKQNALGQDAVAKAQDTLDRQQKELALARIEVEKKLVNLQEEASKLRIANAQKENDALLDLVKGRNKLVDLLGGERKGIEAFTVELERNKDQFGIAMRTFAVETQEALNSGKSAAAIEETLKDIRMRATKVTLDAAIAEAEILKKRQDAIKELSGQALAKESEIQNAEMAVIDATKNVATAFMQYKNAVQEVMAATAQYQLQLGMAKVSARDVTGGFAGINDQIKAVQKVFLDAEDSISRLGAGEKIIADIRKRSIDEQISLFKNLLNEQSNLASSFFTTTAEDQQKLIQGIKTAQSVAGLLGGSFSNFKKLGENAINDLGKQLLNLPQEIRQNLLQAVDTLDKLGVSVSGFTADQLKTAIDTVSLGTSKNLKVDPLFQIQEKIASLTEEQSRLQLDAIIAANEQVKVAREQLSESQAEKALAEIQLERLKDEGLQIRQKITELQGSLETPLLNQIDVNRQGFNDVVRSISQLSASLGNIVVQSTQNNQDIGSRSKMIADAREGTGSNIAALAGGFGASTLVNRNISDASATGSRTSNITKDSPEITSQLSDLNKKVQSLLEVNQDSNTRLASIEESSISTLPATTGGTAQQTTENINVTINAENQVTVNGLDRAADTIVNKVREETGNFITKEQLGDVIDRILAIETTLRNRNLLLPGANQPFTT